MVSVEPRALFLAVLVAVIGIILYLDREKIERHYILFYRRTEKGINLIDRISSAAPRFWKVYGWTAVLTGTLSIIVSTYLMATVFGRMLVTGSAENGPSLVLPGIVSENQFQAGVSFIPIEYWVIGIGILMVVHEFSHGIIARTEGFNINSVGWIILGIIPGAFVEPEGEKMLPGEGDKSASESSALWEQGSWKSRLKVLGAGSFANYLTGAVFLLLAAGTVSAIASTSGVVYVAEDGYPASQAGMNNGTLIQIDGKDVERITDVQEISETLSPGDEVSVWSSEGNYTLEAVEREGFENGYLGFRMGERTEIREEYSNYSGALEWFVSLLQTVGFLNIVIGLFNMLPIKPLDGGFMVDTVLGNYREEWRKYLDTFSLVGWAILFTGILAGIVL